MLVPYSCKEEDCFVEGNDFTTFPQRHSWDKDRLCRLDLGDKTPESAVSILQSWLFFGTLCSVINVPFDLGAFIETGADGRRLVTTKTLASLVTRWMAAAVPTETEINEWTSEQQSARLQSALQEAHRIRSILEEANTALVSISFSSAKNSIVPQEILLSIEILLSSISNSAVYLYGLENVASVGSAAYIDFKSMGMFTEWCPFVFRRTCQMLNSAALYFAGRTVHHKVPRLHRGCTEDRCHSERVDAAKYMFTHCCAEGSCEFQGPLPTDIYRILDDSDYPILLLEADQDGSILIDVVPAVSAPPYVAISHVWAHGLGNPRANTMPTCQLRRLYRLVQDLLPQKRCALWIDTLLCPVEGRYCDLAIAKMVPTYRDARKVLVLDEGILRVSRMLAPTEILLHIASSMWMQRIWTLQEAALPRNLFVQFSDGQLDYDRILRAVGDNLVQNCYETVSRELLNACQTMRLVGIPNEAGQNLDFGMWINMLQYRKTSELRDESLCLATLLGHDLRSIVGSSPEERLANIYATQRIFP